MRPVALKADALTRALNRFLADAAPDAADAGVRRVAFEVVGETVRGITAGLEGTPQRVDTGRYRAAWRVAAEDAGLSTTGLPSGPVQSGDGSASWTGRGTLHPQITIRNNVEYATLVEYGTARMAPGNHLTRALEVARRRIPGETGKDSVAAAIRKAWESP